MRQSQVFQGNSLNVYQGSSVGIVYGRALVAPMPISVSMDNRDIGLYGGGGGQTYDGGEEGHLYAPIFTDNLNGGGTQYYIDTSNGRVVHN